MVALWGQTLPPNSCRYSMIALSVRSPYPATVPGDGLTNIPRGRRAMRQPRFVGNAIGWRKNSRKHFEGLPQGRCSTGQRGFLRIPAQEIHETLRPLRNNEHKSRSNPVHCRHRRSPYLHCIRGQAVPVAELGQQPGTSSSRRRLLRQHQVVHPIELLQTRLVGHSGAQWQGFAFGFHPRARMHKHLHRRHQSSTRRLRQRKTCMSSRNEDPVHSTMQFPAHSLLFHQIVLHGASNHIFMNALLKKGEITHRP